MIVIYSLTKPEVVHFVTINTNHGYAVLYEANSCRGQENEFPVDNCVSLKPATIYGNIIVGEGSMVRHICKILGR